MSINKKSTNHEIFALIRFLASLLVLAILVWEDLHTPDTIPNVVYLLIGGLNGVDAYKLYNDIKKDYDKDV